MVCMKEVWDFANKASGTAYNTGEATKTKNWKNLKQDYYPT